jgi:hypothetical protein
MVVLGRVAVSYQRGTPVTGKVCMQMGDASKEVQELLNPPCRGGVVETSMRKSVIYAVGAPAIPRQALRTLIKSQFGIFDDFWR